LNKKYTSFGVIKEFNSTIRKTKLWENAQFILVDVPLNYQETKQILPTGMWTGKQPTGTLFIANYTKTSFTQPYMEAALLIHVNTPLGKGIHCPWMLVDDDTAMIYGRELLGYPKKMAEFEFKEADNQFYASVSRRGVKILEIEGVLEEKENSPSPVLDIKTFNVGGLGQFFLLNPVWLFRPKEKIHESFCTNSTIKVQHSEFDPIADLIVPKPISGRFSIIDIEGSKYNIPVGIAGLKYFGNTFELRYK
jgi:acetoacetate decarboxylase